MRANREPPGVVRRIVASLQLVVFYLASALYLPVLILIVLMRPNDPLWYRMLRLWATTSLSFFGIRVDASGAENLEQGRDYVLVANHRSHFDVFALIAALPDRQTRWVAKRELERVPIFGYGLRVSGQIIVDRSDHEQAIAELKRSLDKRRATVIFFAEGQRAPTRELLPFKKGGAAFAMDAKLQVVPVAVSGSERVLPKHSRIVCPGTIRVLIGSPIDTVGSRAEDRGSLTHRLRDAIVAMLAAAERDDATSSLHAETAQAGV